MEGGSRAEIRSLAILTSESNVLRTTSSTTNDIRLSSTYFVRHKDFYNCKTRNWRFMGGVFETTKIKPNVAEKNIGADVIYTVR